MPHQFYEQIRSDRWLEFASEFPIAFAQVREDSLLDSWVAEQLPNNSTAIMIASGGCTSSLLLQQQKFETLHLVDANRAQLALCELKIALLKNFEVHERLQVLGHSEMIPSERLDSISEIFENNNFGAELLGPVHLVGALGPSCIRLTSRTSNLVMLAVR